MRTPGFLVLVLFSMCYVAPMTGAAASGSVALRDAPLPTQIKDDIVGAIAQRFEPLAGEPDGRTIAFSSWVSRIRLSATGPAGIEVDGGPDDYDNGATGNGDIWIFRVVGNHASLVFAGGRYSLRVLPKAVHHGLSDLETAWNMSCCDGGIEVYRFDGKRYRPAYCYTYRNDLDADRTRFGPHTRCSDSQSPASQPTPII